MVRGFGSTVGDVAGSDAERLKSIAELCTALMKKLGKEAESMAPVLSASDIRIIAQSYVTLSFPALSMVTRFEEEVRGYNKSQEGERFWKGAY